MKKYNCLFSILFIFSVANAVGVEQCQDLYNRFQQTSSNDPFPSDIFNLLEEYYEEALQENIQLDEIKKIREDMISSAFERLAKKLLEEWETDSSISLHIIPQELKPSLQKKLSEKLGLVFTFLERQLNEELLTQS